MTTTTQLLTVNRTSSDIRITCDKSVSREEWTREVQALGLADTSRFFEYLDNGDGTETIVIEVDK
jgi:hypothetical protein